MGKGYSEFGDLKGILRGLMEGDGTRSFSHLLLFAEISDEIDRNGDPVVLSYLGHGEDVPVEGRWAFLQRVLNGVIPWSRTATEVLLSKGLTRSSRVAGLYGYRAQVGACEGCVALVVGLPGRKPQWVDLTPEAARVLAKALEDEALIAENGEQADDA